MEKIILSLAIVATIQVNSLMAMEAQQSTASLPMLIIVDQYKQENPTKELESLALNLFNALQAPIKFPILVTKSSLYNLLQRKKDQGNPEQPENKVFESLSFNLYDGKAGWKIYEAQVEGLFLLLVPANFLDMHQNNSGLNIDASGNSTHKDLRDITEQLKEKNYLDTLAGLAEKQSNFSTDDLKAVFKEKTSYQEALSSQLSWNIILNGHGSKEVLIAGLDKNQLRSFLSFLNNSINTQLLFVMSCYAGGINRIQFQEATGEQLGNSLNYIVIVEGITDTYTYSTSPEEGFFNNFFYYAHDISKGKGLDELLKIINSDLQKAGLLHPTAHIPQVLLPGGLEFQTFNIDKKVLSLGYAFVQKHYLENKPIIVQSKEAVLVYPRLIPATVQVDLSTMDWNIWKTRLSQWKNLPAAFELLEQEKIQLLEPTPELPAYSKYRKKFGPSKEYTPAEKMSLYPQFIAMNPKAIQKKHWFKQINVLSKRKKDPFLPFLQESIETACGVMQFIRDAFGEEIGTYQRFWIDKLVGPNDLSLLLELSRSHKGITEKHPLETLLQDKVGQEIILSNVRITTPSEKSKQLYIAFTLNSSAWEIEMKLDQDSESYFWDFKKTDLNEHLNTYNESIEKFKKRAQLEQGQKKLPEILQKRAEEIRKMPKAISK